MRRLLILSVCLLLTGSAFAQNKTDDASFISGFEDLPLMAGLVQFEDAAVSFDTPGGRIIEAYAESPKADAKKIMAFYTETLPQLGWKKTSENKEKSFLVLTRDGETLKISTEDNSPVTVRFELTTQQ